MTKSHAYSQLRYDRFWLICSALFNYSIFEMVVHLGNNLINTFCATFAVVVFLWCTQIWARKKRITDKQIGSNIIFIDFGGKQYIAISFTFLFSPFGVLRLISTTLLDYYFIHTKHVMMLFYAKIIIYS